MQPVQKPSGLCCLCSCFAALCVSKTKKKIEAPKEESPKRDSQSNSSAGAKVLQKKVQEQFNTKGSFQKLPTSLVARIGTFLDKQSAFRFLTVSKHVRTPSITEAIFRQLAPEMLQSKCNAIAFSNVLSKTPVLSSLTTLELRDTAIDSSKLIDLSKTAPNIELLDFSGSTGIDQAVIVIMARMFKKVKEMKLKNCGIQGRNLALFAKMPELQTLNLSNNYRREETLFGPKLEDNAISFIDLDIDLAKFPKLTKVFVQNCGITKEEAGRLRDKYQKIQINCFSK